MVQSVHRNKTKADLITEIQRLQDELKGKDILLRQVCSVKTPEFLNLLDHLSDAVILTDIYFVIHFWNLAAEEIYGWKATEAVGKNVAELLNTRFQVPSDLVIQQFINQGYWKGEVIQDRKDGSLIHILASVNLIKDEQDHPISVVSVNRDITERKQTEKLLCESEERYRSALDATSDGLWDWDIPGEKIYYSPSYLRMLGYFPEENPAALDTWASWLNLIHPDDRDAAVAANEACIQNNIDKFDVEFRMQAKDGSWRWIRGRGRALQRDANGQALHMIGTHVDITEYKQAEQALIESEEKFRQIVESSKDVFYRQNVNTSCFEYVSPRVYEMLGYTPHDWMGYSVEEQYKRIHPDDLAYLMDFYKELVEADTRGEKYIEREYRLQNKQGEYCWISGNYSLIRDKNDQPHLIVGCLTDITERKRVAEALRDNERMLSTLIDNLPGFIYRCANDRKWSMLFLSEGCRNITGYASDDFIDNKRLAYNDIVHPDYREGLWQNWQEAINLRKAFEGEYPIITSSGERRWVWERGQAVFSDHGQLLYLEGFITDVTERKRAEEETARMAQMLDVAPNAVVVHDFEGRFLYANQRTFDLHGYNRDEFMALNLRDLDDPDSAKLISLRLKEIFEGGETYFEARHIRKDGTLLPLEVYARVTTWGDARVVLSIASDSTQRKQAEAALRESEERYRMLFEESPISLWEEDLSAVKLRLGQLRTQGVQDFRSYLTAHPQVVAECAALVRVIDVNQATIKLYKAKKKEDILQNLALIFCDESFEFFRNELIFISEDIPNTKYEGTNIHQSFDGKRLNVNVSWSAILGKEKDMSKVIVSIIDITERKRMEESLRISEEKFSTAFHISPDSININRLKGGLYMEINEGFTALTGYTQQDVLGRTSLDINIWVNPNDRDQLVKGLRQHGVVENLEAPFRTKNGQIKICLMSARVIKLNQEICILSITRDITERKQAELQIHEQLDELRRWHSATLGRENRILELKEEVNQLLSAAGQPPRYASVSEDA